MEQPFPNGSIRSSAMGQEQRLVEREDKAYRFLELPTDRL